MRKIWYVLLLAAVAIVAIGLWRSRESSVAPIGGGPITINVVPVPLNPEDLSAEAIGDFLYAGGLEFSAPEDDQLHGLSDLIVTGSDRLTAVGDRGVLLEARLVFDETERLVGISDTRLTLLTAEDGEPVPNKADADAEGLAQLPNGDRLVSFERDHRILLYPAAGGLPRRVAAPEAAFSANGGMEALSADPEAGLDAYVVGAQRTGETWTCRLTSTSCSVGPTVDKPEEFDLVAMRRLPGNRTAHLIRAYDAERDNRVTLQIVRSTSLVARMDMARPLTVDNFEGLAAVPLADGRIRFYLISDDNESDTQRTLLLAFDWRPR